jgi:dTDP-4-dehydrorhamnose 3,5-epimerase-like enzyme
MPAMPEDEPMTAANVTMMPTTARESAIGGLWEINTKAVMDGRGTVREFFRTSGFTQLACPRPSAGTRST